MYLTIESSRLFFLPYLECLEGAEVAEGALRYLTIVEPLIVAEDGGGFGGGAEAGASEDDGLPG